MIVSMCGIGKLGMPVAIAMAMKGYEVFCYDINKELVERYKRGEINLYEPNINEQYNSVRDKMHFMDSIADVVKESEIIFVAVQTPHSPELDGTHRFHHVAKDFDYSYLVAACKEIAEALEDVKDEYKVVSIISTMLPGTTRTHIYPVMCKAAKSPPQDKWGLIYGPSLIAMSTTIRDFYNPEFTLIGEDLSFGKKAGDIVEQFYNTIHNAPKLRMTWEEAEMVKMTYNTFIGFKIIFANTIMELCSKMPNADATVVTNTLMMAKDRLISTKYLKPGLGDSGACIVPGTLVQTIKGLIPIEKIKIGDKVLAHDGIYHPVTVTFKRYYEGEVIRMIPRGLAHFPIIATPEHTILSAKRLTATKSRLIKTPNKQYDQYQRKPMRLSYMIGHTVLDWNPINELEFGDVLALPVIKEERASIPSMRYRHRYDPEQKVTITPDLMYAFGLYLAEGNTWQSKKGGKSEISFNLHKNENLFAGQLTIIFNDYFNLILADHTTPNRKNKQSLRLKATSKPLVDYLNKTFNKLAWEKRVPYEWLGLPDNYITSLVRGFWYGDGCRDTKKYSVTTTSIEIFNFIILALLKLRIPFNTWVRPRHRGKDGVNHRESYVINVSAIDKIKELLPDLPNAYKAIPKKIKWFEGDYMLYFIKNIEREHYAGYVYNLEIEDAQSYCLIGAIAHNCHPRDNLAMSFLSEKLDLHYNLFDFIMMVRERQAEFLVDLIEQELYKEKRNVVILGKTYKPNTNLCDGSCSILIANILRERGIEPIIHDPVAAEDVLFPQKPAIFLLATPWDVYRNWDFMVGDVVIDPWGIIKDQEGVKVIRVGRR